LRRKGWNGKKKCIDEENFLGYITFFFLVRMYGIGFVEILEVIGVSFGEKVSRTWNPKKKEWIDWSLYWEQQERYKRWFHLFIVMKETYL